MSKRISELTPSNVVAPDDQLEIAMVDGSSPTGYVSRRIPASLLGGTMPFRYIVDEQFELGGYATFEVSFTFDELIRSMNYDQGYDNYVLEGGQFRINMQALLRTGGSSNYNRAVLCQTDVFYRKTDPSRAVFYNYEQSSPSGIEMYDLPHSVLSNPENYSNYLCPTDIFTLNEGAEGGSIVIEFTISTTYGDGALPDAIKLYGYADVVVSNYPPGV